MLVRLRKELEWVREEMIAESEEQAIIDWKIGTISILTEEK